MKRKILVVEDEPDIQNMLKIRLDHLGYETIIANHGKEGLDLVAQENPDLIISDILMPVMDGFEFYRNLKTKRETAQIPVIILTAKGQYRDTFMVLGADSFVAKPFDPDDLIFKINKLLKEDQFSEVAAQGLKERRGEVINQPPELNTRRLKELKAGGIIIKDRLNKMNKTENGKKGIKKVLVAGTIQPIIDFMVDELNTLGCETAVAINGMEVLNKATDFQPDIILLEVQMETISAYEIINQFKEAEFFNTQILLYTYFVDKERAKNSIVHRLFFTQLKTAPKQERKLVHYFGFFKKETFPRRIREFLQHADLK